MNAEKFLDAQKYSYASALAEMQAGRKISHWIWYIFPQIAGLGRSATAQEYSLANLQEAKEYLANETLRARLLEITKTVLSLEGDIRWIMGSQIDAMKLRSSMTLFREAEPELTIFQELLDKFYNGKPDYRTLNILKRQKI